MFQTATHALNPFMTAIAGKNQQVWSYVNLVINRPWFFACYILRSPEGDIRETIMLSSIDQVVDLVAQDKRILKLMLLMLVSPPSLNHSNTWLMEPLTEICEARIAETETHVMIYDLANGKRYIDSLEPVEQSKLCDIHCEVKFGKK